MQICVLVVELMLLHMLLFFAGQSLQQMSLSLTSGGNFGGEVIKHSNQQYPLMKLIYVILKENNLINLVYVHVYVL